jgi:hypothetical protein
MFSGTPIYTIGKCGCVFQVKQGKGMAFGCSGLLWSDNQPRVHLSSQLQQTWNLNLLDFQVIILK